MIQAARGTIVPYETRLQGHRKSNDRRFEWRVSEGDSRLKLCSGYIPSGLLIDSPLTDEGGRYLFRLPVSLGKVPYMMH